MSNAMRVATTRGKHLQQPYTDTYLYIYFHTRESIRPNIKKNKKMNETKTRKKRSIVQQQCPVAKHTNTHIVHVLACRTWGTQRGDCDRATSHVNYARSCVRVYVPRKRTNGRKINKQRMEQIDRNSHFICIYYTHACIAYTVCINICIIIKSTQRKQKKKKKLYESSVFSGRWFFRLGCGVFQV